MTTEMGNNGRLCWSVLEVSKLLSLSRNATYQGCLTGQIPCVRIGKRILIPKTQLERLLLGNNSEAK